MAPSANLDFVKPLAYSLLNVVSASGIVFANKAVFQHFDYKCARKHSLANDICPCIMTACRNSHSTDPLIFMFHLYPSLNDRVYQG